MNGTSPRQIPLHILMSLANKYACNLAMIQGGLGDYGKVKYRLDHFFFFIRQKACFAAEFSSVQRCFTSTETIRT